MSPPGVTQLRPECTDACPALSNERAERRAEDAHIRAELSAVRVQLSDLAAVTGGARSILRVLLALAIAAAAQWAPEALRNLSSLL